MEALLAIFMNVFISNIVGRLFSVVFLAIIGFFGYAYFYNPNLLKTILESLNGTSINSDTLKGVGSFLK